MSVVRTIAFYLPQFHPIPENDEWWGKGFTEWTNVAKARPLFKGHYQPHLPADLGFYDLRVSEVREAQAELAREAGIEGFCYYHYWFSGRRLLERPFNEVLATGKPDFPFCLCWANETWTRRWDGYDQQVLLMQSYSEADDRNHARALAPALRDRRYIRVDGKPLLLIYRASNLPDPKRTIETWREELRRLGIGEIFLCCVESQQPDHSLPSRYGFDAAVEFAPDWTCLPPVGQRVWERAMRRWRPLKRLMEVMGILHDPALKTLVNDYGRLANAMLAKPLPDYVRFPCVTPGWDNTPRRNRGARVIEGTPQLYRQWLERTIERFRQSPAGRQIVFINAWNEWAEGAHLEPCGRWGRAYLEATRLALGQSLETTRAGSVPQ